MIRNLLLALLGCFSAHASELRLTFLHLPVYFHSDTDPELTKLSVPFVTSYASPEARLGAMSLPYRPHHDASWKTQEDINLISVYGFLMTYAPITGTPDYRLTIDVSTAKAPEGYPFSVQDVLEMIKLCAPLNYSADSKLVIEAAGPAQNIRGEQAVDGNPH
jgi:hypothetical protein